MDSFTVNCREVDRTQHLVGGIKPVNAFGRRFLAHRLLHVKEMVWPRLIPLMAAAIRFCSKSVN